MKNFEINGTKVFADCGVKGPLLSQKVCETSLTGFEFMIGFPGSIGGEIFMNASCHGQSISDCLVRCSLFDKDIKNGWILLLYLNRNLLHDARQNRCLRKVLLRARLFAVRYF